MKKKKLPITWFEALKMKVTWDFEELPGGFVHVTIHDRHEVLF